MEEESAIEKINWNGNNIWKWKKCYVQACGQHFQQLGGLKAIFVNVINTNNNHF